MITTVDRSALVLFSAQRMFDLVNDVPSYPQFLPWCDQATVLSRDQSSMLASLTIAKGGVRHAFTTHNQFSHPEEIRMQLVEGPFNHLQGRWRFLALDVDACKVELSISFELGGRLAGMAMGPLISQAANALVDAFCRRAQQVYG